jgi:site-specific DNA-methyltransferase (adenine-specific)
LTPYYSDEWITIYNGDCRDVLPELSGIETCITDPPYGLAFMGKDWDHGVPGVEFWRLVIGALLPGASCLAFGGTRTHHRLMCAIEDAGFELRDCLMWLYGSGFPKSHDLSKGIDSAAGAEREVVGSKRGVRGADGTGHESAMPGKATGIRQVGCEVAITAPATEAAKQWNGWGTALKPAWEPIVMAMKPLEGTFARNGLRHGVAGLNVDGARVGKEEMAVTESDGTYTGKQSRSMSGPYTGRREVGVKVGRWPANVVLDEHAAALLDEQSGVIGGGNRRDDVRPRNKGWCNSSPGEGVTATDNYGDSGGASRFFYTAKASVSDRGENNDHPTVKPSDLMKWLSVLTKTPTAGTVLDPFMGSGTTIFAAKETGRRAIGIELDERYCEVAASRCAQGVLELVGA